MAKKKEKKEKKAGKRMSKKEPGSIINRLFPCQIQRDLEYEIYIFGIASHYPSAKNVMRRYIT